MKMKTSNMELSTSKRGRPKKIAKVTFEDMEKIYTEEDDFKTKKRRGRPPKAKAIHDDLDIIENGEELEEDISTTEHAFTSPAKKEKVDKKNYYVDSKRLELLIKQYYKDSIIGDELAIALYNIANRMSFLPNFCNYSWRDEMIGDSIVKEFKALTNKKYDPSLGRAFAYFSQIVFNAFCNKIKMENKNHEAIKNHQAEQYDTMMFEQAGTQNSNNNDEESYD